MREKHGTIPPDDVERRKWQDPEAILEEIGLRKGDTFLDLGCGEGFFALPAARMTGKEGTVYGIDVSKRALSVLKQEAETGGLRNVRASPGKAEETVLCVHCADIAFIGIALHDFEDPLRVLRNARKMTKPSGKLVNLDWKKEDMEIGPPVHIRFSAAKAMDLIEKAGFRVENVRDSGKYHYLVIASPANE